MSLASRTFALHLAMTPGIGGKGVTRVMTRLGLLGLEAERFLKLSPEAWREEFKLTRRGVENLALSRANGIERTLELERRLDGLGVTWVTAADAHYPALVEQMDPDPPGVLFLYGNLRLLDAKTFAVLASRGSLPRDLDAIERLAEEGVLAGEVLVSGHDRLEYQRSAVVPLRWGAPRILVLDRGLFQVLGENLKDEAFRAARLWRYEFDPKTDLVVSAFRPDAAFIGVNNQVRDRLIGCLARRLDFVHVAPTGNMAKLARLALKAGRPVRIADTSIGYRDLVAAGAGVLP